MQNDIGYKIYSLRKRRRLTQEELGNKIGVSKATINKYETGIVTNFKRPTIEALANALDVSPGYLMGWTDLASETRPKSNEEEELLRIYRSLDVRKKIKLLSFAIELEET